MDGSSPRAWGRYTVPDLNREHLAVHPHVRGADIARSASTFLIFGSSPRAWGRFEQDTGNCFSVRFIPTCVGQIQHQNKARYT